MNTGVRESFSSTLGLVLTTVGVAVGLGNIWRFPYMMGHFGGSSFLMLYLAAVVAIGIPALMTEWTLGRYTQRGPVGAYERIGIRGGKWWGYILLLAIVGGMSYYPVVIGWVLYFLAKFTTGDLGAITAESFSDMTGNFSAQFACAFISMLLVCACLYFGVTRGIERASKWITPIFFVLFLYLIFRILSLEGALDGLNNIFSLNWEQFTPGTVLAAMGQALYSLGVGGTIMVIYGSYMKHTVDIPKAAAWTASMDVTAAMMATVLIIPAVAVVGADLASGPPLMFITMPQVFLGIEGTRILGVVFFFSIYIIAMLSMINAVEVLVAAFIDGLGWTRDRALMIIIIVIPIISIPAMLSINFILKSDLIWGSTMQPLGTVIALVAITWVLGRAKALEELSRNSTLATPVFLYYWIKYVIPTVIVSGLVYGWVG